MYEVLNWTILSQTTAGIAKLSCETCAPARYYTMWSGNYLPTFWDNLPVPSSRVKNPGERKQMTEVTLHHLPYGRFVHHLIL
jgi:hypothetical protein